ncbi:MAG: glycosyltransferase, partial [Candidatus Aenigmarchaeota archaeon]|nr:glycosyltransferase [Candidatus Aenigmarchaeota archaeon]
NICNIADGGIHIKRFVEYFGNKYNSFLISNKHIKNLKAKQYKMRFGLPILGHMNSAYRYIFSPFSIFEIRKIIDRKKTDIIQCHYVCPHGVIGALTKRHPLAIHVMGSDVLVGPNKSKLIKFLTKYALKSADLITVAGQNCFNAIKEMGINTNKVFILDYGVDTNKFKKKSKNKNIIKKLNIKEDVVISVRALEPLYDLKTLIKAIPIVIKELPETKFLIGNTGSQLNVLKKLVKKLGIESNVIFIGHIEHEKLCDYYNISDVYVSTSKSDGGISISTLEAMASELPVISTDVGDVRKWITNNKNGIIFNVGDSENLAIYILKILKNKKIKKILGKRARQVIIQKADFKKQMKQMEKLYKKILGDRL